MIRTERQGTKRIPLNNANRVARKQSGGHFAPEKRKHYFYRYIVIDYRMEPFLPTDFPPTDKAAWLVQVQKELKDPSAYETLRWHTDEGFVVEPYYTADDLTQQPGSQDWLTVNQQAQKSVPGWLNTPGYTLTSDATADNTLLRDALTRGADALVLTLHGDVVNQATVPYLARLLNGIKLSDTPIFFRLNTTDVTAFVAALKTVAPYQLKGGLLTNVGSDTTEATRLTADSPQSGRFVPAATTFTTPEPPPRRNWLSPWPPSPTRTIR